MEEKIRSTIKHYQELKASLNQADHHDFHDTDGLHQLEVNTIWDDKSKGVIRVSIFTGYFPKKWWQLGDRSIYSALISAEKKDEWINPKIKDLIKRSDPISK